VKSGQPALIRIDAFPERLLWGAVREITPIAELAGGPVSDVRAYAATIRIATSSSIRVALVTR
jgi:hypothetical protein